MPASNAEPMIAPSILAADFARLADEAAAVRGADWLHVDVMDAHFVPNLTIGLPVVQSLRKATELPLDCHLMIDDPDRWAIGYAAARAVNVSIPAAAVGAAVSRPAGAAADPGRAPRAGRAAGALAGLAVDRDTPLEPYLDLLPEFDTLLVMTIKAGFGGQEFIPELLEKVRLARRHLNSGHLRLYIEVDGGIDDHTILAAAEAGADVFVAGTAVYGVDDPGTAVEALRGRAREAMDRT